MGCYGGGLVSAVYDTSGVTAPFHTFVINVNHITSFKSLQKFFL